MIERGDRGALTPTGPLSLDLDVLLTAVDGAPPIGAAEVVGAALAETLGARAVSFLIADFSGSRCSRKSIP